MPISPFVAATTTWNGRVVGALASLIVVRARAVSGLKPPSATSPDDVAVARCVPPLGRARGHGRAFEDERTFEGTVEGQTLRVRRTSASACEPARAIVFGAVPTRARAEFSFRALRTRACGDARGECASAGEARNED